MKQIFTSILKRSLCAMMQDKFGVRSLRHSEHEMMAALYLQVSIVSQALIFVTRSRSWFFAERPGLLLVGAFAVAQLVRLSSLVFFLLFVVIILLLSELSKELQELNPTET